MQRLYIFQSMQYTRVTSAEGRRPRQRQAHVFLVLGLGHEREGMLLS